MRIVEHAGRAVWVRVKHATTDVSNPLAPTKMMVVIHSATPQGEFSVALPPDKAKELADMIGHAADEMLVKQIMSE
jgi:hypothetical protein